MTVQLSDHFDYRKLLRFTLPSIIMLVFTSVYGVVDGFFVSNFAGKTPFAAVNFIMPFLMMLGAIGFMFGTGGSALIAKTLGEGDSKKANSLFSFIIYVSVFCGVLLAVFGFVYLRPIAAALGAEGELLDGCVEYGRIILLALPAFILQCEFQCLFVTAQKPSLGLYITVLAGVTNMVFDAVLVGVFPLGIKGAALATAFSQFAGGIIPILYFARRNSSLLRLGKTKPDFKGILKTCANGSSELMSNISMSLVGMLYNIQLLKYAGENGIAAYGVLMYVSFTFVSVFIGYSVGVAPVISYHYGAENYDEEKGLLKKSVVIITIFALSMCVGALLLAKPLSHIFVGYDKELFDMTVRGFIIYSFSFLFSGFAIFASSFFTALNSGVISAAISFLRTMVFQVAAVMIFPLIWELDGIWFSVIAAEVMAVITSVIFLLAAKNKYKYF